jgi:hypothetical protein
MKLKHIFRILPLMSGLAALTAGIQAQDNVYPAKAQTGKLYIKNATVHVGNGQVIPGATVSMENGKITGVGTSVTVQGNDAKVIDASGKHLYPGLILSASSLGLIETPTVRATTDVREIGEYNPSIRAIVAYNTDSKITNTVRSNGILLANIIPEGGTISGSSSVVQLDAWNWEDAAYRMDGGLHYRMPSLFARPTRWGGMRGGGAAPEGDPVKRALEEIDQMKALLREAKAYAANLTVAEPNLKLEAMRGLFNKSPAMW